MKGRPLQLLRPYLDGRTQCVTIDNVESEVVRLVYGVPQGSVLGPAKFTMYTVQLGAILRNYQIGYHIHANDTQLHVYAMHRWCYIVTIIITHIHTLPYTHIKNEFFMSVG